MYLLWLTLIHFPALAIQTESSIAIDRPGKIERLQAEDSSILQRHRPFYFAYGRPLSKLQLSFKTPVVRDVPVYFAYTQIMFWALEQDSKPFRDFTYNPELFYRWHLKGGSWIESIDFGGWGHHSNGKAGSDSRSYDETYVRANFGKEFTRWIVRFSTELTYLHGFDSTNRDIQRYSGPVALSMTFIQLFDAWFDKSEISLSAAPGGKFAQDWGRGGYQLSVSFRLGKLNLVPAFYLQYYQGYAETLLNYDRSISEFRGGFIF